VAKSVFASQGSGAAAAAAGWVVGLAGSRAKNMTQVD